MVECDISYPRGILESSGVRDVSTMCESVLIVLIVDFRQWGVVTMKNIEETNICVIWDVFNILNNYRFRTMTEVHEPLVPHEHTRALVVTFLLYDALEVFRFDEDVLKRSLGFD